MLGQILKYDLCIAWNLEQDMDFVGFLETECLLRQVSLLQVTPQNLKENLELITNERITFSSFLDRASDSNKDFLTLNQWVNEHPVYFINSLEKAAMAANKEAMHLPLIGAGIYTPYTIFLPSYNEQPDIPPADLSPLSEKFIIKPAHGGGGDGVLEAVSWEQVIPARKQYPADRYILQTHITPSKLDTKRAWFRNIYCSGAVHLSWWDTITHIYTPVTLEEENLYNISSLRDITLAIASLCKLDLFSTEIAYTSDGKFIVVDYVNDQIDLRIRSKAPDGVPDAVVLDIAKSLAELASNKKEKS